MADVLIPVGAFLVPAVDTTRVRRPTSAELGAMVDIGNHLALWRFKRDCYMQVEFDESSTPLVAQNPSGTSQTVNLLWPSHPRVRYVRVYLGYQADLGVSSADVTIVARLYNYDTTDLIDPPDLVDDAILWSKLGRTLPTDGPSNSGGVGIGDLEFVWPVLTVVTGDQVIADPVIYPSDPRPLNVPAADAGAELRLELVATSARIVWVAVEEGFSDTEPQSI